MTRIPFILLSTSDGSPLTGATPSVTISKDGGAFASATNTPAEIGNGYYYVDLTTAETTVNNNVIVRATATGAQPTAVVWEPEQDLSGLSTFDPSTDDVTINATQADTFATASTVANIATVAGAIKAKTDNLPANPAAVTDVTTAQAAIISAMPDISNLATSANVTTAQNSIIAAMPDISGLSTFDAATDTVTIDATQAAGMATATGFATPTDITDAVTALETYGDANWLTADLSDLATSSELANTQEDIISAMPDISGLPTAADIWEYTDRTLTEEISVEISDENIRDITDMVWNAYDRTLTDLTPKPNQKNIVCTPTNVLNSYGLRRMENWTNEQAGTPAFDTIVNNYIALAKEQMAVDLNNHINAAINYVGADMVTELCAWLTGYKLYSDDESRTTDNLPETRYNMYLEQIHRIMENV